MNIKRLDESLKDPMMEYLEHILNDLMGHSRQTQTGKVFFNDFGRAGEGVEAFFKTNNLPPNKRRYFETDKRGQRL